MPLVVFFDPLCAIAVTFPLQTPLTWEISLPVGPLYPYLYERSCLFPFPPPDLLFPVAAPLSDLSETLAATSFAPAPADPRRAGGAGASCGWEKQQEGRCGRRASRDWEKQRGGRRGWRAATRAPWPSGSGRREPLGKGAGVGAPSGPSADGESRTRADGLASCRVRTLLLLPLFRFHLH